MNIFKLNYSSERIYGLDILRAIAILTVVLGHYRHSIENYINVDLYMFFILDGVTIFFVLSGFLIGGILIKIIDKKHFNKDELFNFWVRRWCRTLPTFLLVFFILIILNLLVDSSFPEKWFYYLFFIQNFFTVVPSLFFPEAWSLSIEEWFYLIIPTLLFFTFKFTSNVKKVLFFWIIAVIVFVTFYRTSKAISLQCDDIMCWVLNIRQLVVTRIDSMMFGFLAAYLNFYHNDFFLRKKNFYFILGFIFLWSPQFFNYLYPTNLLVTNFFLLPFFSIGTMLLLPKLLSIKKGDGFIYRFVTMISLVSYSMYLLHWSVMYVFGWKIFRHLFPFFDQDTIYISFFRYGFLLSSTILLSIIVYKFFELPTLKLRDRYGR
jgi:peptidoglycan/LPS O-acetylase OafA/YrhL